MIGIGNRGRRSSRGRSGHRVYDAEVWPKNDVEIKELLWSATQSHPESPGGKAAFASAAVAESDQPTPNAKQTNSS